MRKIALITGAAKGLGRASAERLARDHTVVVADLDGTAAAHVAATLGDGGHCGLRVDVASEASVAELFETIETQMGPVRLVANFAGLLIAERDGASGLRQSSLAEWEQTFAVNARGCFLVVREMLRRRTVNPVPNGRIITVSSIAGQMGATRGSAAYAASKSAVLAITKAAAREGGPLGLTANAIAPGSFETDMLRQVLDKVGDAEATAHLPIPRWGEPAEMAALVAYLASEESGYMTGNTLDINGGWNCR